MKITFLKEDFNDIYLPLLKNRCRYLHLFGGAGSGKSYFAAQKTLYRILAETDHRILCLRKYSRSVRHSQFALLKELINNMELNIFQTYETEMKIHCKINDNWIITAGVDDREKLKSIHGVTSIWIEEATEISYLDYLQVNLRLRGKRKNYKQIILSYNPIDSHHWLNKFKKTESTQKLRTTYKDNKFIDEEYEYILEDLKHQDENYYRIYALGEWGKKKNIIFPNYEIVPELPETDNIIYGLDFGYNEPTALIEVRIKDDIYFLSERIYERKLTNLQLITKIKELRINNFIYCDASEPGRIRELQQSGIRAVAANKNVKDGLDFVKRKTLKIHKNSTNLINEIERYAYKEINEIITDEPIKFNDHLMDAMRYAIYSHNKTYNPILRRF